MASIVDLCWVTSEELFEDLDLDSLYMRQLRVVGGDRGRPYPYILLIHTGKITVGISLGDRFDPSGKSGRHLHDEDRRLQDGLPLSAKPVKEPPE
jgi:hypothetical protein